MQRLNNNHRFLFSFMWLLDSFYFLINWMKVAQHELANFIKETNDLQLG